MWITQESHILSSTSLSHLNLKIYMILDGLPLRLKNLILFFYLVKVIHIHINNNNSLIIDLKYIPKGLSSPHFHVGCITGRNDSVRTSDLTLSYHLPFKTMVSAGSTKLGKLPTSSRGHGPVAMDTFHAREVN